jgi:DNA primase
MAFVDLNDSVITQVRNAADIVDLVSPITPLKQAGTRYKGLCPFHREKTPSFSVDRSKGVFYCFGCQEGGDVFRFVMLTERMSFPEAVEYIAGRVGITLPRKQKRERDTEKDDLLAALEEAAAAWHQALGWTPNPADAYLRGRGVAESVQAQYGFGYAPDSWDYITSRLGRKFPPGKLEAAGLVLAKKSGAGFYDRFRSRLIVPIHSDSGTIVGFGGRSLDGTDPKYLNSSESSIFNKSHLLYNLHRAKEQIRKRDRAVLVEGYFDCITLDAAGVPGVVASMGTALTPAQASILARSTRRVIVCYDGDDAGKKATLRAAPVLLSAGLSVEVLPLEKGHDPDSWLREHGTDAFVEKLGKTVDIFDFAAALLVDNPAALTTREKQERLESFAPLLSAVSGVARNDAAQKVADLLRLEFETVWSRVRGRGTPVAAERVWAEPVATGEKIVLSALLREELPEELAVRLGEEIFEDQACRTIYSIIKGRRSEGQTLDFSEIQTHVKGEAAVTRLSELLLREDVEGRDRSALENTVRLMERRYIDRRLREIQLQIQEAVRTSDLAQEQALLVEKTDLSRRLHNLK